jgi:hypothetical protein
MDAGHHFDLQRSVLREWDFSEAAIGSTQVANWLTDYYSYSPTSPAKVEKAFHSLHFDNLFDAESIEQYWAQFLSNAKTLIEKSCQEKNIVDFLAIVGITGHVIQDFYAHSNWVEIQKNASGELSGRDWFRVQQVPSKLITGCFPDNPPQKPHGDYHKGLNKDSYVRPGWLEAYVLAYCSTHHWMSTIKAWVDLVDSRFWKLARDFSPSAAEKKLIDFDLKAMFGISMWVKLKGKDGLWKGNGSGDNSLFVKIASAWTAAKDSPIVGSVKRGIGIPLASGLYNKSSKVALPPITLSTQANSRVVIVRVLTVEDKEPWYRGPIDAGSHPDFYAKIAIDGQMFTESVMQNQKSPKPKWTSVAFVDETSTSIRIGLQILDEDDLLNGGDDICDVNPAKGRSSLSFNLHPETETLSGEVNGKHNSEKTAFSAAGKGNDRVLVKAFVVAKKIVV